MPEKLLNKYKVILHSKIQKTPKQNNYTHLKQKTNTNNVWCRQRVIVLYMTFVADIFNKYLLQSP